MAEEGGALEDVVETTTATYDPDDPYGHAAALNGQKGRQPIDESDFM